MHDVGHVHEGVVKGVALGARQDVQRARHLLDKDCVCVGGGCNTVVLSICCVKQYISRASNNAYIYIYISMFEARAHVSAAAISALQANQQLRATGACFSAVSQQPLTEARHVAAVDGGRRLASREGKGAINRSQQAI